MHFVSVHEITREISKDTPDSCKPFASEIWNDLCGLYVCEMVGINI
jgi:hypothetical protein